MALVSFNIVVDRLDDVLALFDRIEVYRSIAGVGGPFTEITDPSGPTAAIIAGTATGTFTLSGETLTVTVDGTQHLITFTGTDPLSLAEVISQINAVVANLADELPTSTDRLRLTSPITGTGSSLLVASGNAATALGLSTTQVNGKSARITIVEGTSEYSFIDLDGDQTYFYQTRYSSTTSTNTSPFSDPKQGSAEVVAPAAQLSTATFQLLDGEGKPLVGQCVRFYPQSTHNVLTTTYHLLPGTLTNVSVMTDETGSGSIDLVRGATYRVTFEGTALQREITVPDQATFDLMVQIGTAPDPFDIAQAPARPIKVTT